MKKKLAFWIPTILLLFPMVGSAIYYFVDTPVAAKAFEALGYPAYVLYFNGIAKFLGAIAIVTPVSQTLKEWAYAGYLFILLLALQAVAMSEPGIPYPILIIIAIWAVAYWQYRAQRA